MKSTGNFYSFKDYLSYAQFSDSKDRQLRAEGEAVSPYFPRYKRALKYMEKYGLTEDSPFCDHPFYGEFEKYEIDWEPCIPDFLCSAAFTNEELELDGYLENFARMHPDFMKMEEYGPHILRPDVSVDDWRFFLRLVFASYGFYYDMKVVDHSEDSRQYKLSVAISTSADDELFELDKLSIAKIVRIYNILLDEQVLIYIRKSDDTSEDLETIQAKKLDSFNVCKFKACCIYRGLNLEEVDRADENLDEELEEFMNWDDDDDDDYYDDDYDDLDDCDDLDEMDDPYSELITDFKETYYYSSPGYVSTDVPRRHVFEECANSLISKDPDKGEKIQRYKDMYNLTSESPYEEHPFFKEYLSQFQADWQLVIPDMATFHPLDLKLLECLIYGSLSSNYTIELDEEWKKNPVGKPCVRINIMAESNDETGEWELDRLPSYKLYEIMEIYLHEQLDLWLETAFEDDEDELAEERVQKIKNFNNTKARILNEAQHYLPENLPSILCR